jgi:alkyldihydroxyacetonephosphate synthase
LTLGHYPQSLHVSTVGGWISTAAMGTFSGRYGGIEHLLLGLDVVLADGTLVHIPAHPRFAAGPPLAHLFVGAEGTLGIVVGATLRVMPVPASRTVEGWAVPALGPALEALRRLIQGGIQPAVLRLYDADDGAALVAQAGGREGWLALLVGFDGHPEVVEREHQVVGRALAALGAEALADVGQRWLQHRYEPPAFLSAGTRSGQLGDAIDVTAWWSVLETAYETIRAAILAAGADSCRAHFSHFYPQGASIYFIVDVRAEDDARALARYTAVWSAAMDACARLGIPPVHHHGLGEARRGWIRAYLGTGAHVLDRLRTALDPLHVLNPDRLGGGALELRVPPVRQENEHS